MPIDASAAADAAAPLVTNAKSVGQFSTTEQSFTQNNHLLGSISDSAEFRRSQARSDRFILQGVASRSLTRTLTNKGVPWRLHSCLKKRIDPVLSVIRAPEINLCSFGGLMSCGSVWVCPICSARISERRRKEIEAATSVHLEAGGGLLMLTLTFSHQVFHRLEFLLGSSKEKHGLEGAVRRFKDHRAVSEARATINYVGQIRALELTYSARHGWHPHVHELWLIDRPLTQAQRVRLQMALFSPWRSGCIAAGLPEPNRQNGLRVDEVFTAGQYLQKFDREKTTWDHASELTKANQKKGRINGITPQDLLRLQLDPAHADEKETLVELFREYARATYGKRQLFWSRGLKALLQLEEKDDQEVVEEVDVETEKLTTISPSNWRLILSQPYESRSMVLRAGEAGGAQAVEDYISSLKSR